MYKNNQYNYLNISVHMHTGASTPKNLVAQNIKILAWLGTTLWPDHSYFQNVKNVINWKTALQTTISPTQVYVI